jgi:hypothetical protein
MNRLGTCMDALRILARTNDLSRVVLIERNIDGYLKTEIGGKERAFELLRRAIHNEEVEKREGEDWSIAKEYVPSLLHIFGAPSEHTCTHDLAPVSRKLAGVFV